MNTYIFSLNEYFENTQKYYYFFDGMVTYINKTKKEVLKEVDIYESSYRSDRLKPKVRNNNKNILLNYFKYKDVDKHSQLKYEVCISKIYYCSYYLKLDVLEELLKELDTYIEENNYLKPLFILFKIFGKMTFSDQYNEKKEIFKKEIDYLKAFMKTNYFTNELAYLYSIIMLLFKVEEDTHKLDEFSNTFKELNWYDYTIRGNYYFVKQKDYDSLMYYTAALKEFNKSYNMERILLTTNNIALAYNLLEKYQLSLDETEKVIKYTFSQKYSRLIRSIAMHYIFSNYMLKRYEEVLNFYNVIVLNEEFLHETSIVAIILSAYKLKKMNQITKLIEKNKEAKDVQIILKAIESIEKTKSADFLGLTPTHYMVNLAMSLA